MFIPWVIGSSERTSHEARCAGPANSDFNGTERSNPASRQVIHLMSRGSRLISEPIENTKQRSLFPCKSPRSICRGPLAARPPRTSASSAVELFAEERSPRRTQRFAEAFPRHAPNLENAEFCKEVKGLAELQRPFAVGKLGQSRPPPLELPFQEDLTVMSARLIMTTFLSDRLLELLVTDGA